MIDVRNSMQKLHTKRIFVTSKSFGKCAPQAVAELRSHSFDVVFASKKNMTTEEIIDEIGDAAGLIVGNDTVDRPIMEAAPHLAVVHMHGTGTDAIDVAAASELGIYVANTPGANRNAVAELTLALMLVAARKIDKHLSIINAGKWEREPGIEISEKVIGIFGLGNIGLRIVELLKGFDCQIAGFDPNRTEEWCRQHGILRYRDANELCKVADFIVLTMPLLENTKDFIDATKISFMKRSAIIVNTARGGLVNEADLIKAVAAKRIAGAALDAFSEEPLPADSPLRIPGIVLTPHLAATTEEAAAKVSMLVSQNMIDILGNKDVSMCINRDAVEFQRSNLNLYWNDLI